MTTTTWTGTNGNWTAPTWTNGVPNASLDAIIDGTSGSPDTVTFNTPSGAAHFLSMAVATLAMVGGTLSIANSSSLSALNQTGGTLDFASSSSLALLDQTGGLLDFAAGGTIGGSSSSFEGLSQSAGTIEVDSGTLLIAIEGPPPNNDLGGTVIGNGELEIGSQNVGPVTLGSGLVLNVATFALESGSSVTLGGNLSYAGDFVLGSGTLQLNADTFTTSGTAVLSGSIDGPGTLDVRGTADANALLAFGTFIDAGLVTQDGSVESPAVFPTAVLSLEVLTGATWDMPADVNLEGQGPGNSVALTNTGLFEKTGGTAASTVVADTANSGTISVTAGTLLFAGFLPPFGTSTFTNSDLVDAAGGYIGVDSNQITNLSAGTLTGGTWEAAAGTLSLDAPITTDAATIVLAGTDAIIMAGSVGLGASLTTVSAGGALEILAGANYTNANALTDSGGIELGGGIFSEAGSLTIAAAGTFSGTGTL